MGLHRGTERAPAPIKHGDDIAVSEENRRRARDEAFINSHDSAELHQQAVRSFLEAESNPSFDGMRHMLYARASALAGLAAVAFLQEQEQRANDDFHRSSVDALPRR